MNGRRASLGRGWTGLSLWKRSRCMRKRRRKRWRSRCFFLTSVLAGFDGTCMPAASALGGGTAPLHTMSLSSILTHGSALCLWVVGLGSGAWHPLTPSWVPVRGVPYHRSWKMWRWFSICLLLGDRSWYASATDHAGMWKWPPFGVLPQVQFLDKVADTLVASMTGAWGRQCRKLCARSCSTDS